ERKSETCPHYRPECNSGGKSMKVALTCSCWRGSNRQPHASSSAGGSRMEMESLRDLYVEELKDVYNAEKQLVRALPRMARAASHEELRSAFEDHLGVTEEQVRRLETIFDDLGKPARGKKCVGMEGIIAEGQEMMDEEMEPEVMDAALIAAAQ